MPYLAAILSALVSFVVVFTLTPWLVKYLRKIGLIVLDQNKTHTPEVPISGGLVLMCGFFAGIATFIFIRTFIQPLYIVSIVSETQLSFLLASIITILIITFIGFADDLVIKSSKTESIGLKQWQKPLLTLIAAIPLMIVNVGSSSIWTPLGNLDVGLIYPLILIPIGVMGAANMVNMLAGYNGLEAGLGLIYTGSLGLFAYVNQSYLAALLALVTFSSLLAFYYYNKVPAKILPGDSMTYMLGAVLACIAIVGNLEKVALIISIPFFVEFLLKLRGRFKVHSFGYEINGKIYSRYKKIYSIPHIFARTGKYTEKQIVYFTILIEVVFASLIWVI